MHVWRIVAVATLMSAGVWTSGAQEPASAVPSSPPPPAPPAWTDRITLKGDVRYRHERIEDDSKHDAEGHRFTRARDRVRARLELGARCSDILKAGIRFQTGEANPTSGNQTLGGGFTKKDMRLDLAYLELTLAAAQDHKVWLTAGKIKNPFLLAPEDLVWDGDLTPEGAVLSGEISLGAFDLFAHAGRLWVEEYASASDLEALAGMAGVSVEFIPELCLTVGGAVYEFRQMQGQDVIDWEGRNQSYGNSTVQGSAIAEDDWNKAWKEDFTPALGFVSLDLWIRGLPVTLYGQILENRAADDFRSGHLTGIVIGRAKNPGTWEVGYRYAELEKDATPGVFTDSDRWGGGTDGRGHKVHARYQFTRDIQAGATWFSDERKISEAGKADYARLQLDLAVSF